MYDVSQFAALHPAGKKIILQYGGKDVSEVFGYFHEKNLLSRYPKLLLGSLVD